MSIIGEPRAFERDRDLRPLVKLISRVHATGPRPDFWHPGGMQWWLRRIAKDDFKVFVWDDGGDIAASSSTTRGTSSRDRRGETRARPPE